MTGNLKRTRPYDQAPKAHRPFIPDRTDSAAKTFFMFAAVWLVPAAGIGALSAFLNVFDALILSIELPVVGIVLEISPATTAAGLAHVLAWGWLTNAALGAIFFVTPRASGSAVVGEKEAVLGAATLNVAVTAGVALLYLPAYAQEGTLTGFPLPVQAVALLGLILAADSFWRSVWKGANWSPPLPWFALGTIVVVVVSFVAMLNSVISLGETNDLLLDALLTRTMIVFWLVAIPIGALHYLVPRLAGGTLYSAQMASLAFGAWAGIGAVSLAGALVHPSIPYAVTTAGNVATMLLLVPTIFIVANLWSSLAGNWRAVLGPGAPAMALLAIVFLVASGLFAAVGSLREVQTALGYTDWPIGLGAMILFGFATLANLALATHAWPRMQRQAWTPGPITAITLWAAFGGGAITSLSLMGLALVTLHPLPILRDAGDLLRFGHLAVAAGLGLTALAGLTHAMDTYLLAAHGRPVATAAPASATAPTPATSQG